MPRRRREAGCCLCAVFLPLHQSGSGGAGDIEFPWVGNKILPCSALPHNPAASRRPGSGSASSSAADGRFRQESVSSGAICRFCRQSAPDSRKVQLALGQLPLRFEPNQGQTDPQVKFMARGAGYGLFLTPDQAILTLHSSKKASFVHMQLAGADTAASIAGADKLPGKSNYFIGNDPAKWHRNIPQFAACVIRAFIPALIWCTTATRDNWSTTSKSLPARTRQNRLAFPGHRSPDSMTAAI